MAVDPDRVLIEYGGMLITTTDLACYMAIVGSLNCDMFDAITRRLSGDELAAYINAYDKARLSYNHVLGELDK